MTFNIEKMLADTEGATPGPWVIRKDDFHGHMVDLAGEDNEGHPRLIRRRTAGKFYTATVVAAQDHEDNNANAHLIAAAPAMRDKIVRQRDEIERLRAALVEARRWIGDGDCSADAGMKSYWTDKYSGAIKMVDEALDTERT